MINAVSRVPGLVTYFETQRVVFIVLDRMIDNNLIQFTDNRGTTHSLEAVFLPQHLLEAQFGRETEWQAYLEKVQGIPRSELWSYICLPLSVTRV